MSDITEQFFMAFGIEPKIEDACKIADNYWNDEKTANKYGTFDVYMNAKCGNQENCTTLCKQAYEKEIYPKITAEKLLGLIRIMNIYQGKILIYGQSLNEIKYDILNRCILMHKMGLGIKTEIIALFKEKE